MPQISVRIPQLGEGLQEALLIEFLKQPGDRVKRDEPIYVMETDKATTDVESPYEGTIVQWTVATGSVLQIGAEIGKMDVAEGVKEMPSGHGPPDSHGSSPPSSMHDHVAARGEKPVASDSSVDGESTGGSPQIPPKTRKYLKEKGLMDVAGKIPTTGKKLMPEDVDAFIAAGGVAGATTGGTTTAKAIPASTEHYDIVELPQSQIVLNYRLVRGAQVCIPVTVMNEVNWTALEMARKKGKDSGGPTPFSMVCWCVVQALKKHNRFRSVISADGRTLKVFKRVNLGVAVALPGDQMVTAVVRNADTFSESDFYTQLGKQIEVARDGRDQADESTTITVSNIGKAGMKIGIPAIVAPAMATLAIGQTFALPIPDGNSFKFQATATATLSFDHRVANGVGAANFLNDVKSEIESYRK